MNPRKVDVTISGELCWSAHASFFGSSFLDLTLSPLIIYFTTTYLARTHLPDAAA